MLLRLVSRSLLPIAPLTLRPTRLCFALILLLSASFPNARAQSLASKLPHQLSHPIAQRQPEASVQLGVGAITIVALRVDFQNEGSDSGLTTGNGKFDLSTRFRVLNRDTVIDPPPHDSNYFLAHFKFLDNYYDAVSRAKLRVNAIMLPGVVHMSQQMKVYSPKRTDTTNAPLARLINEAWTRADSLGLLAGLVGQIDTARTMFLIFHAGAGRDIDLQSAFGFDPTPNDLPSIYMNDRALTDALGGAFDGIHVTGGKIVIRNTGLLPEAETRTIPNPQNSQQTLVIELGMNGLAAAQVGSFLGLPDLFNTLNGKTSIGQLGLMDGSGIFGYGGIFPPEPMAWEKIRLGWIDPIEVTNDDTLSIYTPVFAAQSNKPEHSIYRIPISADEYYLLEVRRRDANADGGKFSTYQASDGFQKPFNYLIDPHQDPRPDSIWGVLMSADEYDWAAFGDKTKGGIAIWHIDESIIRAKEPTDAINADVDHRGIKLEEADAIPDIGVTIQTVFGPVTPTGDQTDFWYFGNTDRKANDPAHVDEFSQRSLPPAKANNDAASFVKLSNFSPPNNVMSVVFTRDVQAAPGNVTPIAGFPSRMSGIEDSIITGIVGDDGTGWLVTNARTNGDGGTGSNYYVWTTKNNVWSSLSTDSVSHSYFRSGFIPREVALRSVGGDVFLYATEDSAQAHRIAEWKINSTSATFLTSVSIATAAEGLMLLGDTVVAAIPTDAQTGGVASYSADLATRYSFNSNVGGIHALARAMSGDIAATADIASSNGNLLTIKSDGTRIYTGALLPNTAPDQALITDASTSSCVFDLSDGTSKVCESAPIEEAALANLEGDATLEVIGMSNDHVAAYNFAGQPVSNVFYKGNPGEFTSNPIVVDIAGSDAGYEILFVEKGELKAYSASTGTQPSGFPLAAGAARRVIALARGANMDLFAVADPGTVLGWTVPAGSLGLAWSMFRHDAAQTSSATSANAIAGPTDFFPSQRAYVWPNPTPNGELAHIRLFVNKNATADCLIVNAAGEEVTTLTAQCTAGADNEILWDTHSLGNGVYTCRLKVTSQSGEIGQKLITVAVVK